MRVTVLAWWEAEDRIFSHWPARDAFDRKVLLAQLAAEVDEDVVRLDPERNFNPTVKEGSDA